jgi:uncharacterized protein YsxB (DUF464 family)
MITAEFISKSDRLIGFKVSGHADFGEYGQDIVCASVSSAVQLVCNTITECFKIDANVSVDECEGIALSLVDSSKDSPANTLIDGLKLHLNVLSEEFPKRINVKITEV